MVQESRVTVPKRHRIVNVIALLLSLSMMLAFTACNKITVPDSKEVKAAVEEEYDMKFKLDSEDISKDETEAEWVFIAKDGTLQVTVSWSAKKPDKFEFDEEELIKVPSSKDAIKAAEDEYGLYFDLIDEKISDDESEAEWLLISKDVTLQVTVSWSAKKPGKFKFDSIELIPTPSATPAAGGGSDRLIKVGIINNDPNESGYRTANDLDMKEVFCVANGYDASFFYSLKNDEQIAAAEKYINDGVDYLLISAAGYSGWDSVLQRAKDAGIKVILFDRTIDVDESLYDALVVSDMAKEGKQAVDWLASQNLDEYKIIHIQGIRGSLAQAGRSGALEARAASDSKWTLVSQKDCEWSEEAANEYITSIIASGSQFNVIYAENDTMAKGAVAALDKYGISHGLGGDVIIISFDCNTWALEELLAGNWNYDGQVSPFQASYIDDIIKNGIKTKLVIIEEKGFDARTITRDDIDKYGI